MEETIFTLNLIWRTTAQGRQGQRQASNRQLHLLPGRKDWKILEIRCRQHPAHPSRASSVPPVKRQDPRRNPPNIKKMKHIWVIKRRWRKTMQPLQTTTISIVIIINRWAHHYEEQGHHWPEDNRLPRVNILSYMGRQEDKNNAQK